MCSVTVCPGTPSVSRNTSQICCVISAIFSFWVCHRPRFRQGHLAMRPLKSGAQGMRLCSSLAYSERSAGEQEWRRSRVRLGRRESPREAVFLSWLLPGAGWGDCGPRALGAWDSPVQGSEGAFISCLTVPLVHVCFTGFHHLALLVVRHGSRAGSRCLEVRGM